MSMINSFWWSSSLRCVFKRKLLQQQFNFLHIVSTLKLLAFCVVSGIVLTAWIASGASDSMEEQIKDSVTLNQ